jgi:ribosomal protein L21E
MEVMMGRYYHLSKKLTEAQAEEVEREMREIEDVESVEINQEHTYMKVITKDDEFSGVMGRAVNICSRVADGAELSFSGFAV